jgi:hypothetical protein
MSMSDALFARLCSRASVLEKTLPAGQEEMEQLGKLILQYSLDYDLQAFMTDTLPLYNGKNASIVANVNKTGKEAKKGMVVGSVGERPVTKTSVSLDGTLDKYVANTGELFVSDDITTTKWTKSRKGKIRPEYPAVMIAPLEDKVRGDVVALYNTSNSGFSTEQQEMFEYLSKVTAHILSDGALFTGDRHTLRTRAIAEVGKIYKKSTGLNDRFSDFVEMMNILQYSSGENNRTILEKINRKYERDVKKLLRDPNSTLQDFSDALDPLFKTVATYAKRLSKKEDRFLEQSLFQRVSSVATYLMADGSYRKAYVDRFGSDWNKPSDSLADA